MAAAHSPRGFSLLFVCTMLVVLSMGTAVLMSQVTAVASVTGGQLRADRTLAAARAGVVVGSQLLQAAIYATDDAPMDLTALRKLPALAAGDAICADGADCRPFRLLAAAQSVGSNGETARLAVSCNPGGCGAAPEDIVNFQLRVLGSLDGSNRQLVEVYLVPNDK